MATRIHLVLVAAIAFTGIGLLATIGAVMLSSDGYSRDMGLLGAIITAPIWLVGIGAAIDLVSVLRGRRVSRLRAAVWGLVGTLGAMLIAMSGGQLDLVIAVLTSLNRVQFEWPKILLVTADGMGRSFLYANRPDFWAPFVVLPLGVASLVATGIESLRTAVPPRTMRS